jgi:hypothetical protein
MAVDLGLDVAGRQGVDPHLVAGDSSAMVRVACHRPPLAAAYGARWPTTSSASTEAMLTMLAGGGHRDHRHIEDLVTVQTAKLVARRLVHATNAECDLHHIQSHGDRAMRSTSGLSPAGCAAYIVQVVSI